MLLLERLQRPIDDCAERGSLPRFRSQHVVRPVQRVQATDEGIALLGMLIQRLIRNGLDRGQRVFYAMFHLAHDELLTFLCTVSLGNIPGNLRCPHDPAIRIRYGRYGQRDFDQPSVLAATNRVVMSDALPPPDPLENFGFLIETLRRNQDGHRLAHDLWRGVAKESLCTAIPTCDAAVEVFADDRIVRGFND